MDKGVDKIDKMMGPLQNGQVWTGLLMGIEGTLQKEQVVSIYIQVLNSNVNPYHFVRNIQGGDHLLQ